MIRAATRSRSGITLTEILISILIMSIGVISIATLFPLGLIRLRKAQQYARSAYLVEAAAADFGARNLLTQSSFIPNTLYKTASSGFYNPLYVDTATYGADWGAPTQSKGAWTLPSGANRYYLPNAAGPPQLIGPGLPVCYDPLWRCVTGIYADPAGAAAPECRFGSGINILRGTSGIDGLPRITNFQASLAIPALVQSNQAVLQTFVSPEDLILQETSGDYANPSLLNGTKLLNPSPVVPALTVSSASTSSGAPVNDWRYTWFFTGQQSDPSATAVDGDIVICENRPLAIEQQFSNTSYRISGEMVVEAIWGYTASQAIGRSIYGSPSGLRSVYLRWPASLPDPDVRVGGWIADVTYERIQSVARANYTGNYPPQRCYWYQVAKKSAITDDANTFGGESGPYRMMMVWTTTQLRAQTPLNFGVSPVAPLLVETALVMPSVVNVYPRTVFTR